MSLFPGINVGAEITLFREASYFLANDVILDMPNFKHKQFL